MALCNLFLALEEAWKIQALVVDISKENSMEVPYQRSGGENGLL